jgi:hypothetical protein
VCASCRHLRIRAPRRVRWTMRAGIYPGNNSWCICDEEGGLLPLSPYSSVSLYSYSHETVPSPLSSLPRFLAARVHVSGSSATCWVPYHTVSFLLVPPFWSAANIFVNEVYVLVRTLVNNPPFLSVNLQTSKTELKVLRSFHILLCNQFIRKLSFCSHVKFSEQSANVERIWKVFENLPENLAFLVSISISGERKTLHW